MINFEDLPEVPKDKRPMDLFVRSRVSDEERKTASKKGWLIQDVRLIKDAAEAIRATFEGARLGTILLSEEDRATLVAEAKMHGAMSVKEAPKKESKQEETIDQVLSFSKQHGKDKIKVIVPDINSLREISHKESKK